MPLSLFLAATVACSPDHRLICGVRQRSYLSFLARERQSSHGACAGDSCRVHLADLGGRLHRIDQAYIRVVPKHIVIAVLAVDQLELVELHVLGCLLEVSLLLQYFVLQLLDQFSVLGSRRSPVVHLLQLSELLVQVTVLLVHEGARIAKFALQSLNFCHLLAD